jgi:hypothetical protein
MATFFTDSGSINRLEVSGSVQITGSSHLLTINGSGSKILVVSGSSGGLLEIGDISATDTDLYVIESASIQIFKISNDKQVSISGSLVVTGSFTASLQNGFALVGGANGFSRAVATSSFGGSPGGSNGSIQFNDSTQLSGSSRFNFDKTTNEVDLTGSMVISGSSSTIPTLQLFGSGSTIFSISGSRSELFRIADSPTFSTLATIGSGSLNVLTVTTSSVIISGALLISGSMVFIPGGANELTVGPTGVTLGNSVTDAHRITGSLSITGSFSASLANGFTYVGGADNITRLVATSSFGGGGTAFPHTGSAIITGSLTVTGSVNITGSLLLNGSGVPTVTGQIILTAGGGWPSITSGSDAPVLAETATNRVNFYYIGFPNTTQTFANWAMPMPSDYNGGTIAATFYWAAGTALTNSVRWGLQARAYADSDLLDQAFGTAQEVTDANQATDDVNISAATAAITIGGTPAAGNFVQFRAYRNPPDAADTLAATAELLSIRVTYTRA